MAYSFAPQGQFWGGSLGGYGSLGAGAGLANALGVGLNLADGFRKFQNNVYMDQAQLPAEYRGHEAALADNTFKQEDAYGALNVLRQRLNQRMGPGTDPNQAQAPQAWQTPLAANAQQTQQMQPQNIGQMLQVGQQPAAQPTGIRALDVARPPAQQQSLPYQGPFRR